jgi:D-alanyl-D-alanine carboxypeptidase
MIALVALLFASSLAAQVDAIAGRAVAEGVPGMAVLVQRKGEPPIARGYGFANLELSVPASAETLFRIGSITKQFTAAAVLQLAEQGKLKLDDELAKHLPDAPVHGRKVTIEQLLNHTSGIHSYTARPDLRMLALRPHTPAEIVALVKDAPPDFEPGASWRYNNTGYVLLGMVIEKVSGLPYARYLEENVLPRAGLTRTVYCDNAPILGNRAAGYGERRGKPVNAGHIDMSFPFSAGALCSTVGELSAWARALESGKVVSAASYAKMITPAKTADGKPSDYGFGLGIGELEGHRKIAHGGGINGFSSGALRLPDDDVTVVVLCNSEDAPAGLLADQLARAALGLPIAEPKDLPLPPEEAARFEGRYKLGEVELLISARAGKLFLRAANEPEDEAALAYQGGGEFAMKSGQRLRFRPPGARAEALELGDGKRWLREARRVR